MKVVLKDRVAGLGEKGEEKEVKEGYARNFLLPRRLALKAYDPQALSIKSNMEKEKEMKEEKKREEEDLAHQLEGKKFMVKVKVNSKGQPFSAVNFAIVKEVVKAETGIEIKDAEGLPIKKIGKQKINLVLEGGVKVEVDLIVEPVK